MYIWKKIKKTNLKDIKAADFNSKEWTSSNHHFELSEFLLFLHCPKFCLYGYFQWSHSQWWAWACSCSWCWAQFHFTSVQDTLFQPFDSFSNQCCTVKHPHKQNYTIGEYQSVNSCKWRICVQQTNSSKTTFIRNSKKKCSLIFGIGIGADQ